LPFQSFTALRSLPGLKLLLISASWTYLTFVIPQLLQNATFDAAFAGEVFFRTLFIAAITLPFDMRDIEVDNAKMYTLPQLIGKEKALNLALFGVVCYQFWIVYLALADYQNWFITLFWWLGLELGLFIIKCVKHKPTEKYISFWVEAIPIILALLVILGNTLATSFNF
jgi:1,4-dihydroxy-2-naphthoate octaprenyltransferase